MAAADTSDRYHTECLTLLETDPGPLVTTAMVIAETIYLLAREIGPKAEVAIYDAILDKTLAVEPLLDDDWRRIRELVVVYEDLGLGGTDASLIAVAERLGVTRVATIDGTHFRVVRPSHCDAFELLPAP